VYSICLIVKKIGKKNKDIISL